VKPRKARQVREPAAVAPQIEKDIVMNFDATNWMNNFNAVPGADKVQNLFAEGRRGRGRRIEPPPRGRRRNGRCRLRLR
jgi:hypothetical protein